MPTYCHCNADAAAVLDERAAWLASLATAALLDELDLTPKPALVDRRGSGAHDDMDHALLCRSAHALTPGFAAIARAAARDERGQRQHLRAELGRLGREAEVVMLRATHGVNTHRGAIWALGLIVAAAAALPPAGWRAESLLGWVAAMAAIDDPALAVPGGMDRQSNGQRMRARFRVRGARHEAANGFAQIVTAGLPALRATRAAGHDEDHARLDALLAIMAVLDDTCLLSRAGVAGLALARQGAGAVLQAGGAATADGRVALARLESGLIACRASPGGSADLLAATLLIDRLEACIVLTAGTAAKPSRFAGTAGDDRPQESQDADVIA